MSEIFFIRHAQASFGADDYDQLSPNGIRQAEILARFLETHRIRFDAIYTGRMERQKDTAKPICQHLHRSQPGCASPVVMEAFDEYDHLALIKARIRSGHYQGAIADLRENQRVFQAFFSETVDQWMAGAYDGEAEVEPWPDFCRRVGDGVAAIRAAQGGGKRIAVVTSGGPIAIVLKAALGLSDPKTAEISWQILNASLTCLKYHPEKLTLTVFNNTTHLQIEGDPALLTLR